MSDTIVITEDEEKKEKSKKKKQYDIKKYLSLINSTNPQWMKDDTYFKAHNEELSKEESKWRNKIKYNANTATLELLSPGLNNISEIRQIKNDILKNDILKPIGLGLLSAELKILGLPSMDILNSPTGMDKVEEWQNEEDTGKALVKEILGRTFSLGYTAVATAFPGMEITPLSYIIKSKLKKIGSNVGDKLTENNRKIMGANFEDGDVRRISDKPTPTDSATSNAYAFTKIENKPLENYQSGPHSNKKSHADIFWDIISKIPEPKPGNMEYDAYHGFSGKSQRTDSSTAKHNSIEYDAYHGFTKEKQKENNTYWIKETANGLVIKKPGQKEQILKPKKPPILQLFQPWNIIPHNSITQPASNNNRRSSTQTQTSQRKSGKKRQTGITQKERDKKKREMIYKANHGGFSKLPLGFADGGLVKDTTLSYVGEDGPEAIIPLGSKRRQRGLDLWNKAGAMLGVPGYANGAIIGGKSSSAAKKPKKEAVHKTDAKGRISGGHKTSPAKVSVGNISINVKGNGGGSGKNVDLLQLLKAQRGQVSDELCSIIADAVEGAYKNIPVA